MKTFMLAFSFLEKNDLNFLKVSGLEHKIACPVKKKVCVCH